MKLSDYIHDKILILIFHIFGILLISLYLLALNNHFITVMVINIIWLSVLLAYLVLDFFKRKTFFKTMKSRLEQLDKPYLIHEFIELSWRYEDRLYKEIITKSNTSALEAISKLEKEQEEYKSFIEAWIHEVKLPMTSISLITAELDKKHAKKIESYLVELENQVEQALFYARSEHVYQDYLIRDVSLYQIVSQLIKKNKYLLIQNQIQIHIDCQHHVSTDSKWLQFILNQILFNAVKYKKESDSYLSFTSTETKNNVTLSIKDNGIGIKDNELPRVFHKGFTGTNGRHIGKSTGFGLYLCKKLCTKLGLSISIDAKENEYTELFITFPKNHYLTKL